MWRFHFTWLENNENTNPFFHEIRIWIDKFQTWVSNGCTSPFPFTNFAFCPRSVHRFELKNYWRIFANKTYREKNVIRFYGQYRNLCAFFLFHCFDWRVLGYFAINLTNKVKIRLRNISINGWLFHSLTLPLQTNRDSHFIEIYFFLWQFNNILVMFKWSNFFDCATSESGQKKINAMQWWYFR